MLCLHAVIDEDGHPLTNRAGDYVNTGVRSLKRVSKVSGTIAMKLSCGMFRMRWEIDKRNPLHVPMGFQIFSRGVLEDWALNSFTMHTNT